MKKYALLLLLNATLLASCHFRNHDIRISVNDNEEKFRFAASYPENKTSHVQQLINEQVAPNSLFSSANDYTDVTTVLQDQTRFHIKSSPGSLQIQLNKNENDAKSYQRIKNMCEAIKETLKQ